MKNLITIVFAALFLANLPAQKIDEKKLADGIYAKITTDKGSILIQLFYDKCPMTVANFVGLAEGKMPNAEKPLGTPYFDGIKFHRVISKVNGDKQDFMIQGGDPKGNGMGGPGYAFKDEFVADLKHEKGTLSMANSGPATNGSQFFITIVETPWLNNKHTVFGKVIVGQNVVDSTTQGTVMNKVTIIRKGKDAKAFDAVETFKKLSGVTLPTPPQGTTTTKTKKTKTKKTASKKDAPSSKSESSDDLDKELDKNQPNR
jgi:peptidyl-prolyl cis-trans isomerase A (cyclophilin A)